MAPASARNQNMKRPILETRRQMMSAVVCAYPGGRECAAARLGLDLKKFDNHLYESAGSRPLSDEQVHLLEQQAGTSHFPEYVAAMYGGVFVPDANPVDLDNVELYERSIRTAVLRGTVDQLLAEALADGEIDEAERKLLLAAHRRHMAARHVEINAVIVLHQVKTAQQG